MLSVDLYSFRECLHAGQIVPHFQPIVELKTGNLVGFEILARWRHPDAGPIPPDRFVPAVEKAGMISELTNEMLALATQSAADWQAKPALSLNISPLELRDCSLPQRLKQIAEAGGLPLDRLVLEITEKALIHDLAAARSIMEEMKGLGIRLALDDLGSGYSSLHYLQALPFDEIKIDGGFVRRMNQQRESRQIVASMVGLGLSLGLSTVAEGVEEQAQAEVLASLGCECGQGWLFGRPVAAEEVPDVIARFSVRQSAGCDAAKTTAAPEALENHASWRTAHDNPTKLVRTELPGSNAQIRVDEEPWSPKEIAVAANKHHIGATSKSHRRKSIWNLLKLRKTQTPPEPSPAVSDAKEFRRALVLLMRSIEFCAISGDGANSEQFSSYLRDAAEKFAHGSSGSDALNTAKEIQARLKNFSQAGRFFTAHKQEYQKVVSMFMETIASLSASGQRTIGRLKEIEKSLQDATLVEDIRENRLLLGECLTTIRDELVRQESVSAGVRKLIQPGAENDGRHNYRSAAEREQISQDLPQDPVTGLLSPKQAESALLEALNSGDTYFVVAIIAKGADVIYSLHGEEVGDSVLYHFAEKLRGLIGSGDRLFRWRGASFVALAARITSVEARREYNALSTMGLEDAIQVGSRLMWVQVSASWKVIAVAPPYSSLILDIDQFVLPE